MRIVASHSHKEIFPIHTAEDIQDALKNLLGGTIKKMMKIVRKVIYMTNAIESLNSTYWKLNHQRSVFPIDTALVKALYLTTFEATKKWMMPMLSWAQVYGELGIMYEGHLPEYVRSRPKRLISASCS